MTSSITIGNSTTEIADVHTFLTELVQKTDAQEGKADELCLIAEEILVNIITHGHSPEQEDKIRIDFREDQGLFYLEFHDNGKSFDPLEADERPEGKVGGWGIPLVKALCEHIEYNTDSGHNVLAVRVLKRDLVE